MGRALLLTGVYGAGKSTVAAEIADLLDARDEPYAAIDLDWLAWANVEAAGHEDPRLLVRNLASVVANDRAVGVTSFVLAGTVETEALREAIRGSVGEPLVVIRLEVSPAVVTARLSGDPTRARADDLAEALHAIASGRGIALADSVVDGVGPVRDVAQRVLDAAGWS
ncbi:MAG TPA: hypothetical protein VH440_11465 [Candidatus Limnocylindrales bacterium]